MQIKSQGIFQRSGEEYYCKIVQTFGEEILNEDKEIDRRKLANIVFQDKKEKKKLDDLTLSYVVPKIKGKADEISEIRNWGTI